MISRSVPSYGPIARARPMSEDDPAQCEQLLSERGSGSPHVSQMGGVVGRTAFQQLAHTHPASGSSNTLSHTAQTGARRADISALPIPIAIRGIRGWGLGIRLVTTVTLSSVLRLDLNL